MNEKRIGRISLEDLADTRGDTDWERLRGLSDSEIEHDAAGEPDADAEAFDWSQARVLVPPQKTPVSIRLDEDVVAWFRDGGPGYQTRINAVLRAYMEAKTR